MRDRLVRLCRRVVVADKRDANLHLSLTLPCQRASRLPIHKNVAAKIAKASRNAGRRLISVTVVRNVSSSFADATGLTVVENRSAMATVAGRLTSKLATAAATPARIAFRRRVIVKSADRYFNSTT